MSNHIPYFFTQDQGNLFIRLLLAHIAADFVFQTNSMVQKKTWFSKSMFWHIAIVFSTTLTFSLSIKLALVISLLHWLIDSSKGSILQNHQNKKYLLFVVDQIIHLLVTLIAWCWYFNLFDPIFRVICYAFNNYKISLLILSYSIVIWPTGFVLRFALQNLLPAGNIANVERGGKLIGQFERIIILTFVLLNQYEAIGFLITGKSIIRFAQREENLKSEYVLVGTMMSYALSILIGVFTNWLIAL